MQFTRSMNHSPSAITLLTEQHDEVDELFEKIEGAKDRTAKKALFKVLADNLAAHVKIEESQFYPAVLAAKTEDMLLEATEEHLAIKRVLADLLELEPDDEHFDAKLEVMKEQIAHHAHAEEEKTLFPLVERMMSKEELAGLGAEMLREFEELMESDPRCDIPGETARAATLL